MKKLFFIITCLFLLTSCATETRAPIVNGWDNSLSKSDYYVVQKNDTLYSIAVAFNADMVELIKVNKLTPPYDLQAGQKIKLVKPANLNKDYSNLKITHWEWPSFGRVVQNFSDKVYVGGKGIDIENKAGAPIVASAPGKVIYSGSGLSSYGSLIIIRHNNVYNSLYANVTSIEVSEGQFVKAGQKIAKMGVNSAGKPILHFEIRRNKKPVDPMPYLKH